VVFGGMKKLREGSTREGSILSAKECQIRSTARKPSAALANNTDLTSKRGDLKGRAVLSTVGRGWGEEV